eukprot:Rhum_TRINITY_DN7480_c0_g1::Rhum_TRINITY_DN7480_c0_g1_i1::g.23150::m.23150
MPVAKPMRGLSSVAPEALRCKPLEVVRRPEPLLDSAPQLPSSLTSLLRRSAKPTQRNTPAHLEKIAFGSIAEVWQWARERTDRLTPASFDAVLRAQEEIGVWPYSPLLGFFQAVCSANPACVRGSQEHGTLLRLLSSSGRPLLAAHLLGSRSCRDAMLSDAITEEHLVSLLTAVDTRARDSSHAAAVVAKKVFVNLQMSGGLWSTSLKLLKLVQSKLAASKEKRTIAPYFDECHDLVRYLESGFGLFKQPRIALAGDAEASANNPFLTRGQRRYRSSAPALDRQRNASAGARQQQRRSRAPPVGSRSQPDHRLAKQPDHRLAKAVAVLDNEKLHTPCPWRSEFLEADSETAHTHQNLNHTEVKTVTMSASMAWVLIRDLPKDILREEKVKKWVSAYGEVLAVRGFDMPSIYDYKQPDYCMVRLSSGRDAQHFIKECHKKARPFGGTRPCGLAIVRPKKERARQSGRFAKRHVTLTTDLTYLDWLPL